MSSVWSLASSNELVAVGTGTAGIDSHLILRVMCSCSLRDVRCVPQYITFGVGNKFFVCVSFGIRSTFEILTVLHDEPVHDGTTRRDFAVQWSFSPGAFNTTGEEGDTLGEGSSPRSVNSCPLRILHPRRNQSRCLSRRRLAPYGYRGYVLVLMLVRFFCWCLNAEVR